ncbi:hypothetical protein GCK32_021927, partial [Trichostrongylus colubriformis]
MQTPKNRWHRVQQRLQIAWTIILSTFICMAMAVSIFTMPPAYCCIHLTGCIDFFFLMYWTRSMRELEYSKRLKKSSIGIGTLKNTGEVMRRR